MPEQAILEIAKVLPYRTSCHLNWSGVEVHRYRLSPGESSEFSFQQPVILIPHIDEPSTAHARINGVEVSRQVDRATLSIVPPGLKILPRRAAPREVTVIFLDPAIMGEVARLETGLEMPEIQYQFAIHDPLIRSIGMALDAQLTADYPCAPFYAEILAKALAAHIVATYAKLGIGGVRNLGPNRQQLRRSLEFIHNNAHKELTLGDVAAIANMSKFYFAKSFRSVMGIPPHRYIVKLRMEKARKLLLTEESMSIEDVARHVGYADASHFRQLFRRIVGVSASRYRPRG
jgi:AraC family transcriptional regulator